MSDSCRQDTFTMAPRTPPPQNNPMYPYVSYPAEYYPPAMYPGSPIVMPSMPPLEQLPSGAYFPHPHFRHAPPSPDMFPPSPVLHGQHSHQSPPSTPCSSSSSERTERAEVKVLRQLCTAITKMQSTMKDVAERQEQILDRMSLLEQRGWCPFIVRPGSFSCICSCMNFMLHAAHAH